MYSKLQILCIGFLFVFTFSNSYAEEANQKSAHELQLLIDVSGSMKQNDPNNLRIPAVKLLVNLLPNGSKAGIWLFAQDTKVLIETGLVNNQWKKKALSRISKIHSRGLFTNIEDAIQTSANNWFNSPPQQKRNLILLTDGMVDVSKDIMQSAESRERVLADQIPLLQQAGVNVQTIALSDNADAELLDKLAFDTNGWSETTQSADQLQKVFFKMFKKAIPQDTVPIKGNAFIVDSSINEFSVLIFKKPGAPATQLYTPDKTTISSDKHTEDVAWLEEKNYDLITIKKPQAGKWKIVADIDADNQVMIVTDLKFKLDEIPNHIAEKEPFDINAFFTSQDQLISKKDFLSLIEISIEITDEMGGKDTWKMQAVLGQAGLFSKTIGATLAKGKHTIKVIADGKTFQRENVQTIEVVESLVTIETEVNTKERSVKLKLMADETVLITQMMTVQAMITQSNKEVETQTIEKKDGHWELVIDLANKEDSKIINFSVMAKTVQGSSVSPDIKPVIINEDLFSKSKSEQAKTKPVEEIKKEPTEVEIVEEETDDKEKDVAAADEKEPVNWITTGGIVFGINIFLIVAGIFLFKFIKKRALAKQTQLLDRLA